MDVVRAVQTGGFGAGLVGPVGHFWYLGLDKVAAAWFTPGSWRFIATKVGGAGLVLKPSGAWQSLSGALLAGRLGLSTRQDAWGWVHCAVGICSSCRHLQHILHIPCRSTPHAPQPQAILNGTRGLLPSPITQQLPAVTLHIWHPSHTSHTSHTFPPPRRSSRTAPS